MPPRKRENRFKELAKSLGLKDAEEAEEALNKLLPKLSYSSDFKFIMSHYYGKDLLSDHQLAEKMHENRDDVTETRRQATQLLRELIQAEARL